MLRLHRNSVSDCERDVDNRDNGNDRDNDGNKDNDNNNCNCNGDIGGACVFDAAADYEEPPLFRLQSSHGILPSSPVLCHEDSAQSGSTTKNTIVCLYVAEPLRSPCKSNELFVVISNHRIADIMCLIMFSSALALALALPLSLVVGRCHCRCCYRHRLHR